MEAPMHSSAFADPAVGPMDWLTFPVVSVLLFAAAIYFWIIKPRAVTQRKVLLLEYELASLKTRLLLVTTSSVPGERTVKTLGYIEALSPTEAASDWEYRLAEKEALLDLVRQGLAMGANAIVGLRKSSAHYDQTGSRWRVSRVTYQGTAVVVNQKPTGMGAPSRPERSARLSPASRLAAPEQH